MSEELEVIETTPAEEVLETIPETPVLPELEYSYQPRDEEGRPLGGKQVIKYTTPDELASKLAEQNTLLVRKLRAETRKNRLGVATLDEIPDTAPRFTDPVNLNPRPLTAEERIQLSQDLLDPEKFEEAQGTIFEATVGMKPADLGSTLRNLQNNSNRILAKTESDAFMAANPAKSPGGYFPCAENFEVIASWMGKNNLAPLRQNFQLAFDTLKKEEGVILMAPEDPIVVTEPVVIPPSLPEPEPVVEPVVPRRVVPTSGLTREKVSNSGASPKTEKYTLAQIERMSADEYKRKLHEPGFVELVNKLEEEAIARRNQKRRI
jgi:hypothetical protein